MFTAYINLHGYKISIPSNYIYPIVNRMHPQFNNPYLELVYQTYLLKKRKLNIIDIGAAIGDTFFLIKSNIPQAVNKIYCIDGSEFFLSFLKKNLASQTEAVIIEALLSDNDDEIPELVMHHGSSAMAVGNIKKVAVTLDSLFKSSSIEVPDVIKIDVDGYDGKILHGSSGILKELKPNIIFEYHPGLIIKSGNDLLTPFLTLNVAAYQQLLWYDKYGNFSHVSNTKDYSLILQIAGQCLDGSKGEDYHYDIIALGDAGLYDIDALKKCLFASTKKYPY